MKLLNALLTAAMILISVSAQGRDTEVSVSYGAMLAMSHVDSYHGNWSDITSWGTASFTIDHRFADRLWMGLSYTLSGASSDRVAPQGGGDIVWHGLMANARYEWLRTAHWTLYSHAGVGALITYYSPSWRDSYNTTRMAFQANPVGAQCDFTRHIGVFAEAGYGIEGIVKIGLRTGF